MNSQSRIVLFTLLTLALAPGCASIVSKPDINHVKKIAIVSFTAPQTVPYRQAKSAVTIGFGSVNPQWVGDQALTAYTAEFKRLGWDAIPPAQLGALATYKENFEPKLSQANNVIADTLNKLSSMNMEGAYFFPTGLQPVLWEEEKSSQTLRLDLGSLSIAKPKTLKTKMQELAAKAGADAAVLIQAQFCYDDGALYIGKLKSGTGTAVLVGNATIYAVNAQGVEVVKMKQLTGACGGAGGVFRIMSDTSTVMAGGHLVSNEATLQKMFQEVLQKLAKDNVADIQAAMKD